ncbi:MAG: hypothetical protein HFI75_12295 [Lachnospiraceae bacterium]|nr:hypothetical protein [Lachnospiraceae bacterium]
MKYLILDYSRSKEVTPLKSVGRKYVSGIFNSRLGNYFKGTRIYKEYEQNRKCRQLFPQRAEFAWEELEFICITLPMSPEKLGSLPEKGVQRRILESLDMLPEKRGGQISVPDGLCLLEAQKGLEEYIPPGIFLCEDKDEVYIKILNEYISHLTDYGYVYKRNARLLFLDDGSHQADVYIQKLVKDWNYVSVFSSRHEHFEKLYQKLYEEEGLMIECAGPEMEGRCSGDIVIDLTAGWKGLQYRYPIGAYVLDVTFSRAKEEYLRVKNVPLSKYVQLATVAKQGYGQGF